MGEEEELAGKWVPHPCRTPNRDDHLRSRRGKGGDFDFLFGSLLRQFTFEKIAASYIMPQ